MSTGPTEQWNSPATVNKDGSIVIETHDKETGTRRQLIFRRVGRAWELSICVPGVGTMPITLKQASTLADGLRAPQPGEGS